MIRFRNDAATAFGRVFGRRGACLRQDRNQYGHTAQGREDLNRRVSLDNLHERQPTT